MHTEQAAPAPRVPISERKALQPWDAHQQQNADLFPTMESWRWFVRQNRAELIECGALCMVAGRLFVLPQLFDQAVVDIGRRMAAQRVS